MTTWTQVLRGVSQAIRLTRDELNRLDGTAGDGDLGLTMTAAAAAASAAAERGDLDGKPLADALRTLGTELARAAPSTSGTLFARGLLQAAREAGARADDPPVARAATLLRAGIAGIQKAGQAEPGDRTMLDALVPMAEALQVAADQGQTLKAAMTRAAGAARAGAAATKDLEPKVGRASWIAERAKGNVDAGAYAVSVIAEAVAGAID